MKKTAKKAGVEMRKEYDFSHAKRGIAYQRYSKSLHIALLTPEIIGVSRIPSP